MGMRGKRKPDLRVKMNGGRTSSPPYSKKSRAALKIVNIFLKGKLNDVQKMACSETAGNENAHQSPGEGRVRVISRYIWQLLEESATECLVYGMGKTHHIR